MKFLFKWAFRLVFLLVALVIVFFLSLDSMLKAMVEKRISAQTGMDVQIGKCSVGLLSPAVNVQDFRMYNTAEFGGAPFLDVRELHVEYNRSALVGRQFRVTLMRLNVNEVNVVRNDAGRTNVVIAAPQAPPGRANPAPIGNGITTIDLLNLSVGKVGYIDLKNPKRSRELRPDMQNQIFKNVRLPDDLGGLLSWIWFRSGGGFGLGGLSPTGRWADKISEGQPELSKS